MGKGKLANSLLGASIVLPMAVGAAKAVKKAINKNKIAAKDRQISEAQKELENKQSDEASIMGNNVTELIAKKGLREQTSQINDDIKNLEKQKEKLGG